MTGENDLEIFFDKEKQNEKTMVCILCVCFDPYLAQGGDPRRPCSVGSACVMKGYRAVKIVLGLAGLGFIKQAAQCISNIYLKR